MLNKEIIDKDSKQVMLETLNANEIRITGVNCDMYDKSIWNGYSSEVDFGNVLSIKEHEKIAVNINGVAHNYNIARIHKISDNSFLIQNSIPTKTKHFILPVLGSFKEDYYYNTLLINCYLSKSHNSLYLEYRFISGVMFNLLDKFLREHDQLIRVINPDYSTIIYEMEIPSHYLKDVKLFIEGKYSQFSDRMKKRILTFHKYTQNGETYKILYKDTSRRKQLEFDYGVEISADSELFDIPTLEDEYYKESTSVG